MAATKDDILALEPRLLDWASRMTRDANEAQALVRETMAAARAAAPTAGDEMAAEVWVFRLLRERFHSLERDRHHRRATAAFTTDQTYVRKRSKLALAAAADIRAASV